MQQTSQPVAQEKPKLLEAWRLAIRARHYSRRTEEAYIAWIKRFIFFHGKRRRHHLHESVVQRAVKEAVRRAGIAKPATCHSFRHSGVYPALCGTTHLLEDGYDIRTVQELLAGC